MSTNVTRRVDPLEDFFRGFFVRPVDFGGGPVANMGTDAPQMRVDVKENADGYEVHAELPGMKKEDVAAAMDGLRKELREANEAAREVRHIVGDVAMDSAAEIYGFALDHMKVDRAGVEGAPALRALFKVAASHKVASPVHVAQDSAGLAAKFPGAARFSNA
jgi:hypothetical protein